MSSICFHALHWHKICSWVYKNKASQCCYNNRLPYYCGVQSSSLFLTWLVYMGKVNSWVLGLLLLSTTWNSSLLIAPLFHLQLKQKGEASNGKPEAVEELREAIFLAEEACPGISDSMVTELVQRLQRYDLWIKVLQHLHRFLSCSSNRDNCWAQHGLH